MSAQALVKFENASKDQRNRNEARRIRTKVNEARKKISDAGIRWPFELLQNALDAGPCPGKETIDIKIGHSNGVLTFEHTGAPFTTNDLAALLSGGSNKDFESVIRFVSLITNCLCFIYVCFFKYIYKHLLLCLIILSKATNNSTKSARKACLSNSRARKSLAIRWTKT